MANKTKKENILGFIKDNKPLTLEALTLTIFLVIFANFILAIFILRPFGENQKLYNFLILIFFFTYYILLLFGLTYYYKRTFMKFYQKNEIAIINYGLFIGLIVLTIISYIQLGLGQTLMWAPVTLVTLVYGILQNKFSKK